MKAVILAGGVGSRLRPYTTLFPKPLMPIGDMPILEIILKQLADYGITDLVFAVGYLNNLIQAYFGDGARFGVKITYSVEETPLGTAGPLSLVEDIDEDFLVLNGDILTDLNFRKFIDYHKQSKTIATLAVYMKKVEVTLGVLDIKKTYVTNYTEKPVLEYPVSTGIYCFTPKVLEFLENNTYCDFPELILRLLKLGKKVKAYRFDGQWLDIGRPEDYEYACKGRTL